MENTCCESAGHNYKNVGMARINVTKSFLPEKKEFLKYVDAMWESAWLTNNGPFLQELEKKISDFLPLKNVLVCGNGTIVLQMAIKALNIKRKVITTPFSYVATLNAILWENCEPVFVDIDPLTLCIDAGKIEEAITEDTEAILCTHVYGYPCDVDRIADIASRHQLKVIYDAAHAFGARLGGKSLLAYGDVSTCSFHATKLFHSVEGGCVTSPHDEVFDALYKLRQFGHIYDDYYVAGINGKNSELHSAMGLCVLPHVNDIIEERRQISAHYDSGIRNVLRPSSPLSGFEYNYGYYPVILESEEVLMKVMDAMAKEDIFPRRYFYPSLNKLGFVEKFTQPCPVSEDISRRVLCLPLYAGLDDRDVDRIIGLLNSNT